MDQLTPASSSAAARTAAVALSLARALHRERFDLHELLIDLMDDYRPRFDARRVRLSIVAPIGLRVSAEPGGLIDALASLIEEALIATPPGGAVVAQARRDERAALVTIRNGSRGARTLRVPLGD